MQVRSSSLEKRGRDRFFAGLQRNTNLPSAGLKVFLALLSRDADRLVSVLLANRMVYWKVPGWQHVLSRLQAPPLLAPDVDMCRAVQDFIFAPDTVPDVFSLAEQLFCASMEHGNTAATAARMSIAEFSLAIPVQPFIFAFHLSDLTDLLIRPLEIHGFR